MLIASTNPLIVYFYKDGLLNFALRQYNSCSKKTDVHYPKKEIGPEVVDRAEKTPLYGLDKDELQDMRRWDFERLGKHLKKEGRVKKTTWVKNYLIPEMETAVVHLMRMSQGTFLQRSQLFQFFAVDFLLDENLKVWFMDVEANPSLKNMNLKLKTLYIGLFEDILDVTHKYLRSRLRRIAEFVNKLSLDVDVRKDQNGDDKVIISDLYTHKENFAEVLKNKLEKKDALKKSNKFEKVIDENYPGYMRYNDLIKQSCY